MTSPTDVADLSQWNVTLPVNSRGELFYNAVLRLGDGSLAPNPDADIPRSSAATVPASGYESQWFYGTDDAGVRELHLIAPAFGSTTTPRNAGDLNQSDHSRCELRGITQGARGVATCFRRVDQGIVEQGIRVIQRPAAKGSLVLAQIHALGSATFVLLKLASNGQLYGSVSRLDGKGEFSRVLMAQSVPVGALISMRLAYTSSTRIDWRIAINGAPAQSFSQAVESGWDDINVYFKVGAYTSIDVEDSLDAPKAVGGLLTPADVTDVTHVAIRDLSVRVGSTSSKATARSTPKAVTVAATRLSDPKATKG